MEYRLRIGTDKDNFGIAETIAEAFYDQFKAFSESITDIAGVLAPAIDSSRFYIAEETSSGLVVGVAGFADEGGYPIGVQRDVLKKKLGWVKGTLAAWIMKDEFYTPKRLSDRQAHIGFVGVREGARGRGIARKLIRELLASTPYAVYTLDVVEGNEKVLPLYEGLGFQHIGKKQERFGSVKGFTYRYLMEYRPEMK